MTPPLLVTAQVRQNAAAIAVTPVARPVTGTGVSGFVVAVPSPSVGSGPQHMTPPLLVRAQEWL
jgi:hypothetical protein